MNEKQVCKKRKCISLEVKIEIIKKHTEQKITTSKLAKVYNVNASTISTILSSKAKNLEHYDKNLACPGKKHIKLSSYDNVDQAVLYWFDQAQKYNNITISGIEIQLQALKFATMLGHRDFKASNGWLSNFKQRNEAIERINELKQFFLTKKDDNSNFPPKEFVITRQYSLLGSCPECDHFDHQIKLNKNSIAKLQSIFWKKMD
ncbi:tigger transposable element-derived 4 [Brachionus plicatilis]|uniref:Tigger transposable element-derived 4 n=1 Tax=Brachionus plicatilis TaxID=10195 RepID=A0A3M7SVW3_BRAPC|nr:tigger transposable element-derived 4 [Brachionus plicatilis]